MVRKLFVPQERQVIPTLERKACCADARVHDCSVIAISILAPSLLSGRRRLCSATVLCDLPNADACMIGTDIGRTRLSVQAEICEIWVLVCRSLVISIQNPAPALHVCTRSDLLQEFHRYQRLVLALDDFIKENSQGRAVAVQSSSILQPASLACCRRILLLKEHLHINNKIHKVDLRA
jgi:hypothetical protein